MYYACDKQTITRITSRNSEKYITNYFTMSLQKNPTNLKALSVRFDTDTQEVITIRDNVEPPFLLVFIIEWYKACFYNIILKLEINAMTQLKMVTILLTYTVQGNSLPAKDSLLDLWQPHNHIASTTLLSFQHPLNFELESQYQLISSKQADMLITTPRFFKIPYYKIK